MRSREEMERLMRHSLEGQNEKEQNLLIFELFLDIRDLLANPVVEISGEPMKITSPL